MENDIMDDEKYYITLKCWECDHPICRLGDIVHENSKDGCLRQVNEDLFIEYYHQLREVWPFILQSKNKEKSNEEYEKTLFILNKVYASPYTKKYGEGFKVIVGV